jgi:hypothetical protein
MVGAGGQHWQSDPVCQWEGRGWDVPDCVHVCHSGQLPSNKRRMFGGCRANDGNRRMLRAGSAGNTAFFFAAATTNLDYNIVHRNSVNSLTVVHNSFPSFFD